MTFLLDTNVISELMRAKPAPAVRDWLNRQGSGSLFLSAITIGEIEYGLRILPRGKKRQALEDGFERLLATAFEGRVLTFNQAAAHLYGDMMAGRREIGRPLSMADGQIASIAKFHRLTVATRNVRDFELCGLNLVNPFEPLE